MKYLLEKQETIIKPTAVYCRTAQAVIHSFRWKQIALSDNLDALKKLLVTDTESLIEKQVKRFLELLLLDFGKLKRGDLYVFSKRTRL